MAVSPVTLSGTKLAYLRFTAGLSQQALADRADLHVSTINEIETGKRQGTARTWKRLADSLNVTVLDFIEGEAAPVD